MSKRPAKSTNNAASLNFALSELSKYGKEDPNGAPSAPAAIGSKAGNGLKSLRNTNRLHDVSSTSNIEKVGSLPPGTKKIPALGRSGKIATSGSTTPAKPVVSKSSGISLAAWLESLVPHEKAGFPGIEPTYLGDSTRGGSSACIKESFLPLWCFLDVEQQLESKPREWLKREPIKAVALPIDEVTGIAGNWSGCMVIAFEETLNRYVVSWSAGKRVGSPIVHRSLICFERDSRETFASRLLQAIERRDQAEALLRQSLYVESMPISFDIQLDSVTISNILSLTLTSSSVPENAGTSSLFEEVNNAYMHTMNKLIYDTNADDIECEFPDLRFPENPLPPPPPHGGGGVVPIARYDYNLRFVSISTGKFINMPFAVSALFDVRKSCVEVESQKFLLDQQPTEISFGDIRQTPKSITLTEFGSIHAQMSHAALRCMRDNWTRLAAKRIQFYFSQAQHPMYNIAEPNRLRYLEIPTRCFLQRVNYMVEDTLRYLIRHNFTGYTNLIEEMLGFHVDVKSPNDVRVVSLHSSSSPTEGSPPIATHQPMFRLELTISTERCILNQDQVDKRAAEIREWCLVNALDRQAQCPFEPLAVEHGYRFEYATSPKDFQDAITSQFDVALQRLKPLGLVERLVMDRIFWPNQDCIACLETSTEMVAGLREQVREAITRATTPLLDYHAQFDSYIILLNMNVDEYLRTIIKIQPEQSSSTPRTGGDEGDGVDKELPPLVPPVELNELRRLLNYHRDQEAKILETIPSRAVNLGLFQVDLTNIRFTLAKKHHDSFLKLLDVQVGYCFQVATRIMAKFEEINQNLAATPKDIESLTALQEYIAGIPALMQPLQDEITQMMKDNGLIDEFQHYVSDEHLRLTWNVQGWPTKITAQSSRFKWALEERKGKFAKQMESEQERYEKTLATLLEEIESFSRYDNLAFVDDVAHHAMTVQKKLEQAQQDAMLLNSRETLFGKEVTSYDTLALAKKNFEPYNQLWTTSYNWIQSRKSWIQGSFTDINAEEVEKLVETYSTSIQKAFKFFSNNGNEACTKIAETVKEQILVFKPKSIGFDLEIDESFTFTNIFQLNLLDCIDDIVKIAEAAGKEYQVEQALGIMKGAWEKIDLQIISYRETGTYVIKGVDEIQVVLDEHVTMTQAMMFSSFKGPSEEEITEWNATLQMVSEVLEEWLAVQRNWLYLQPIFESPDINKQLPAEGKRFASVDKNWCQTLASAKAKPKAVEFCRDNKSLEKFRESNHFLEMVQKGLSDCLEVKRSSFARFYFLSNDELLSILPESKDVKLVQPHLKKCFEGIIQVTFEDDLNISAMISAEGEKVQFVTQVDPKNKNVEHWMMEVENMMEISIRDAMERAIIDYTKIDRTVWIQKWPGMCVLNGSQMHWTREMEEAMDNKGKDGVTNMMARQLGQLADMVTLVRGNLDKMSRITCGTLTVIDVHARDVTRKLVAQNVESKGDFLWSSQLKYYWEKDLWVQAVTSRRPYGYEYLGNSFRLVITPLTDK